MSNFYTDALRIGRLRRRLSQGELAQKVGVSTATLCRIENGQKVPTAEEIQAIAKALSEVVDVSNDGIGPDIAKLAEPLKQLRIEINLEDIAAVIEGGHEPKSNIAKLAKNGKLVIFVSMAQLQGQHQDQMFDAADSEVDEVGQYPRQT